MIGEQKSPLVPISQVRNATKRVSLKIPFPDWFNQEQVVINVRRSERLMNLGGIRQARVTVQKNGGTSVSIPIVESVNSDGSANASWALATRRAPTYSWDQAQEEDGLHMFQNSVWTNVNIKLNCEEMERRIVDSGENFREPRPVAHQLDEALRGGLREAGTKHLLAGHNLFRASSALAANIEGVLLNAAGTGIYRIAAGTANFHSPSLFELGVTFTLINTFGLCASALLNGLENKKGQGHRWSLFFLGCEVDRAALLQGLTRTLPLIEPIEKERAPIFPGF
jgi:hypothetical protein